MSELFCLAGGSMVGRDHRLVFRNNQDAYHVAIYDGLTVAVVADGCGSGSRSEVGAQLGVRIVAEQVARRYAAYRSIDWARLEQSVVSQLDVLASNLGGDYRRTVEEYLLFTLVGVALTAEEAVFFACGDGVVYVNGEPTMLGPYPGNMPPYIAYRLLASELRINPDEVRLRPVVAAPVETVDSFLIGTDGVDDIIRRADRNMPGLEKPVGEISQFWSDDRYFKGNLDLVSRQLRLMGRDYPHINPDHGLLSDDTTLVVGRRA